MPAEVKPEQYDAYQEARNRMREAEEAVHSAIVGLRSAALRMMQQELLLVPAQRRAACVIEFANSNKAQWSGGPDSPRNLIETATREAVIEAYRIVKNAPDPAPKMPTDEQFVAAIGPCGK